MIQYEPVKALFSIGNLTVHSWGLVFVVAFLTAFFLILRQAKRKGIKENHIYNIALLLLIGAIVGSRIFHVFENFFFYFTNPAEIFALDHGGMTSYGGIFLALLFGWLYIKKQKLHFGMMLDLFAPYIALALAIGRIGCFLNWCCYGIASNLPWAISAAGDIARHPTQIYLMITNLITFSILIYFRKLKEKGKGFRLLKKPGSLFLFFLVFYCVFRLAIDFLREYSLYWLGLALSQWICLAVIIISLFLLKRSRT